MTPDPMQSAAPPADPAQGGGQGEDAYRRTVLAAAKVIYDDASHEGVVRMLSRGEPAEALAATASTIISQLDERAGGNIPADVVLPAAGEVLRELAKLAGVAGLFQADPQIMAAAEEQMVVDLGRKYGVPDDQIQQAIATARQGAAPDAGAMPADPADPAAMGGM